MEFEIKSDSVKRKKCKYACFSKKCVCSSVRLRWMSHFPVRNNYRKIDHQFNRFASVLSLGQASDRYVPGSADNMCFFRCLVFCKGLVVIFICRPWKVQLLGGRVYRNLPTCHGSVECSASDGTHRNLTIQLVGTNTTLRERRRTALALPVKMTLR